jgi:hypothetical protein
LDEVVEEPLEQLGDFPNVRATLAEELDELAL